jgi:hypothetical protein
VAARNLTRAIRTLHVLRQCLRQKTDTSGAVHDLTLPGHAAGALRPEKASPAKAIGDIALADAAAESVSGDRKLTTAFALALAKRYTQWQDIDTPILNV